MDGVAELNELPIDLGGEHRLLELGDVFLWDEGVSRAVEDEDLRLVFCGIGL